MRGRSLRQLAAVGLLAFALGAHLLMLVSAMPSWDGDAVPAAAVAHGHAESMVPETVVQGARAPRGDHDDDGVHHVLTACLAVLAVAVLTLLRPAGPAATRSPRRSPTGPRARVTGRVSRPPPASRVDAGVVLLV